MASFIALFTWPYEDQESIPIYVRKDSIRSFNEYVDEQNAGVAFNADHGGPYFYPCTLADVKNIKEIEL